jgi:hypothetical protein
MMKNATIKEVGEQVLMDAITLVTGCLASYAVMMFLLG